MAAVATVARADERGAHAPIRLELGACIGEERDAIERELKVELGDDVADDDDDPRTVIVRVGCTDTGVAIEVRRPDNPRRYRYALDWSGQPTDARPRLVGLAVAEALDASRIELVAVPEPTPPPVVAAAVVATAAPAELPSAWLLSVLGGGRSFLGDRGVGLVGLGVLGRRRISPHLFVGADAAAEIATVLVPSGALHVTSVSSAPQVGYRIGDRVHADGATGVRVGIARVSAESLPGTGLVGRNLTRGWFGPFASAAIAAELTPRIALEASLEIGVVVSGIKARDLGDDVADLSGGWTSLRVAVTIPL